MGIVVIGAVFVDIKGFPEDKYLPTGRNVGRVEYIHGGVCRNVVEDIANIELRPTFVSIVDDTAMGADVVRKLKNHKVNTEYVLTRPDGMGTWLAVFDNNGDVAGSISKRADLRPIMQVLEQKGDEIFGSADSVIVQIDMDKEMIKECIRLAKKHRKPLYGVVANMTIAAERRDFLKEFDCFVCNLQEAELLFCDAYEALTAEELSEKIADRIAQAEIPAMVVTMGGAGSVYANLKGEKGICPAKKVLVKDTTGAGDSFCAGVSVGLTYGKTLQESVEIGTRLAASVIVSSENVCPRFLPKEFGLNVSIQE